MIKVHVGDRIEWSDSRDEFLEIQQWAQDHCKSFVEMNLTDVSDLSMYHDIVGEFTFTDERDVTMFKIRWS